MSHTRYATFWQRFGAGWIDFFVFLPLFLTNGWPASKLGMALLVLPLAFLYPAYSVYLHGRWGQTVGKWAMGIRVLTVDGHAITWRQAWLRAVGDWTYAPIDAAARFTALATIADAEFYGVSESARADTLYALQPAWAETAVWVLAAWTLSEVVVMLFNAQRRSLHDFLAGTIVARVEAGDARDPASPPQS